MDEHSFGALLRDFRLAAGLSQEALAGRADISTQAVSALEGGRRRVPRRETVELLTGALGLDREQAAALTAAIRRDRVSAPAVVSLDALPVPGGALLGREAELRELAGLLGQAAMRLLALVGPGGVGKTRLALQVAHETAASFPEGAVWVDLSSVRDAELVAGTIATRLGVRPAGLTPLATLLLAYLAERRLLLVLDNLEQVLQARGLVQQILDGCPGVRVLATSRVPLGLDGEQIYTVAPLALPPPGQRDPSSIAGHAAVALFVERAREVAPRLMMTAAAMAAIAAVCRRLDGLPLAIELAAALVKLLPPQAMLASLIAGTPAHGGSLNLLTGGAWDRPDRQQTMRDTIAWSHDLLGPDEQRVFRRLAVFAGGCTVAAAAVVCAGPEDDLDVFEILASLLDKSLLIQLEGDHATPRVGMLETNRDYAIERLALSEDGPAVRERHARYFLDLALEAEPELIGPHQSAWLQGVELELDNIRAVLLRSVEGTDTTSGLRLASALLTFWTIRGRFSEGRTWLERLLEHVKASGESPMPERAQALHVAGRLAYQQSDNARALAMFEESLALFRLLGDSDGILSALNDVGGVVVRLGDHERAAVHYGAALALRRERGETRQVAHLLNNIASSAFVQEDYARAVAMFEESLDLLRGLDDRYSVAVVLSNISQARLELDDTMGAAAACEEGLPMARELQAHDTVARFLTLGGSIARRCGEYEPARMQLVEALIINKDLGVGDELWRTLEELAMVALDAGRVERSAVLLGAVVACYELAGDVRSAAELATYDRCITAAVAALGAAAFQLAWERGRAFSLDDAVEYARGDGVS